MQRLDHTPSHRARRRVGVVAGVVAVGLSISACSNGGSSADAASDTTAGTTADTTAGTTAGTGDSTVTDGAATQDSVPSAGPQGQPGLGGPGFGGPGVTGEVTAVDGSTLTIEQIAQDGTITETTVETTDATTVTETVTGSLGDLAVGDEIVVDGGTDGAAATSIAEAAAGGMVFRSGANGQPPVLPDGEIPDGAAPPAGGSLPDGAQPPVGNGGPGSPGGPGGPGGPVGSMTFGTITAIADGSVTIQIQNGETTNGANADGESIVITTDDSTVVRVSEDRSVGDIEVGDTIRARADTPDSGDSTTASTTITAANITLEPAT